MAKAANGLMVCALMFCANVMDVQFGALLTEGLHFNDRPVPNNHEEAMASPWAEEWRAAEQRERTSIREKGVLGELEPIPKGRKVRTVRYVYKWKPPTPKPDGSHISEGPRAKCRAACRDFHWLGGDSVGETYAPTGKGLTFRLFMLIALLCSLIVHHVDVETAFLYADLGPDEEYWMTPLPDETGPPGWGYRLRKSLYGLRVAPRHWYRLLSKVLLAFGFAKSLLDTCLFWKWTPQGLVMVLIYVDDILIAAPTEQLAAEFKAHLQREFKITDCGPVQRYLSIRVRYVKGESVRLDQQAYTQEVLDRFEPQWKPVFGKAAPKKTPLPDNAQEWIYGDRDGTTEEESSWFQNFSFRSLIGCLLYLSINTRPDIAFAVGLLARVASKPTYGACYCAAWLLSYLSGTVEQCIMYPFALFADLYAMVDADWGGDVARRRSTSGYIVYMCGGPLAWGSKLMTSIATSSMQAEFQSYYYCISTLLFIRHLLAELQMPYLRRVPMFTDSEAARYASLNAEHSQRTKSFEIQYWWSCSFIGDGDKAFIDPIHIGTLLMTADLLTKVMIARQCEALRGHLMGQQPIISKDLIRLSRTKHQRAQQPDDEFEASTRRPAKFRGGDLGSA